MYLMPPTFMIIGKQLCGTVKGMDPKYHDHRIDALAWEGDWNNNNEARAWKNLSHGSSEHNNLKI